MDNKKRLVFATNNAHKLEEARRIIAGDFEIVSLAEIGCHDDIPETADTLEGNALIKARWVKERYGCDCFADDTGLMVDALGGAPGVYSARYAGEHCTPADNVARMLQQMNGVENRDAHFSTVIALAADGEEHLFEGSVEGSIATQPHGNSGFGYDPIFIAKESGKCFAEMDADAKNAISHRGRAMRKLRDFLATLTVMTLVCLCAIGAKAEEWRLHSSFDGQMERVIDTPDYVYFLGASQQYDPTLASATILYGVLMRYDKQGEELQMLNSGNILNGNTVSAIEYNREKKYLVVAYDDGNIDLLYDNGDVYNVPGLKMADSYSKNIYSASVDAANGIVYLGTDFGYITIKDSNHEIGQTKNWNTKITAIARTGDDLWIATGNEILKGSADAHQLSDFTPVASLSNVARIFPLGNAGVGVIYGSRSAQRAATILPAGDGYTVRKFESANYQGLEPTETGLLLSGGVTLTHLLPDGSAQSITMVNSDANALVGSRNFKDFWQAKTRKGIALKRFDTNVNNWSVLKDWFLPNTPNAFQCTAMGYSPDYGVLVRNHGMDLIFNDGSKNYVNTDDLVSAYRNLEWKPASTAYRSSSQGLVFKDPNGLAVDPLNPDHVYGGSLYSGLLRLDLSNPDNSIHMSRPGDTSNGNGKPGFAVIVEDPAADAFWPQRCLFTSPCFDYYNNLWTAYVRPCKPVYGSDHIELWYWTPEDRAATTSAQNVRPFRKLIIEDEEVNSTMEIKALTAPANKNLIVIAPNIVGSPLIILDHNGTPDDTSDDRIVRLKTLYDQDGSSIDYYYAYSIYEDQQTGLIWIGTSYDIFTIDPKTIFSNPTSVRRIKVARNDGTNLADYLLNGVRVYQIITDPSGNKWYATNGAGLMCTTSDGRQILKTYTTENSPLPSDILYSLCYNPQTNSLMISTSKGLCELFLSGSANGGSSDAKVYPNPVRPDYHGYVTIEGLPDDATVKILDSAGALIKECGSASAGVVQWNLTNQFMRRVPGGIYFIVATNGPDSGSYSKVGKVLVID